jgi:DNA-binding NarL/FixJ family response regulator
MAPVERDFRPLGPARHAAYASFMKSNHEVTVLIVDEHTGIPKLLAERLDLIPGIRGVGETANVMLRAELAHQFEPDVILADFRRTGPPRAETYRWLFRVSPSSRVVAHTSYLVNGDERALREAGVARCILKGESVKRLGQELLELTHSGGPTRWNGNNGKEH